VWDYKLNVGLIRLIHREGHDVYLCKRCFETPIEVFAPKEMAKKELNAAS
jgi:hypothetical protein